MTARGSGQASTGSGGHRIVTSILIFSVCLVAAIIYLIPSDAGVAQIQPKLIRQDGKTFHWQWTISSRSGWNCVYKQADDGIMCAALDTVAPSNLLDWMIDSRSHSWVYDLTIQDVSANKHSNMLTIKDQIRLHGDNGVWVTLWTVTRLIKREQRNDLARALVIHEVTRVLPYNVSLAAGNDTSYVLALR